MQKAKKKHSVFSFIASWKKAPENYKRLCFGLLLFALFNGSDIFLLLRMKEIGGSDSAVIRIYIFYNIIYALASYPLGFVADKIGLKKVLVGGMLLFSLVYAGMGLISDPAVIYILFALYGIYSAATEGISKAWISNLVPKNETATAVGNFTALQSIFIMLASMITGLTWFLFNAPAALVLSASAALLGAVYISIAVKEK